MSPHRVLGNGTTAYWKKVGIVCGGIIGVITLATLAWRGASSGAVWSWRYANRENARAMNSIIDRVTGLQVRDSLDRVQTDHRLTRVEDVVFKRHRPR